MPGDDLRHALRRLRAQPATAVIAAALLALAIGVASAMFTIADHLLIRPVPYRDPATLVTPYVGTDVHHMRPYVSRDIVRAWRSSRAFSGVHAVVQQSVVVDGASGRAARGGMWISPGTFEMLGVSPALGRSFVAGEGRPGTDDRVIVSDEVWRKDYASDPQIIGRRVMLSGSPATVVGVMPVRFHFPYWNTQVWRPYDLDDPPAAVAAGRNVIVYARIAADVPAADAAALATAAASAVQPLADGARVIFRGIGAGFLDDYSRTAIAAFVAGVALVFLVLCANVTSLMFARTTARRREFGVCSALGASRTRLLRQALMEIAVTAAAGALAGMCVATELVALAQAFLPSDFLVRTLNPVHVDARSLLATTILGFVAVLIAGVPPAWLGTALNPVDSMRLAGRTGSEPRSTRNFLRLLLVAQVALATAVLAGAALLLTSFVNLTREDSGLDLHGVTSVWVSLPRFSFADRASRVNFAEGLQHQLGALPGVEATTLSFGAPPEAGTSMEGQVRTDGSSGQGQELSVESYDVGPQFFNVYGIRLLAGREFVRGDDPHAVIVSERLAARLWPGQSPLGHTFMFDDSTTPYRVIGVSREVRSGNWLDPLTDTPEFYSPLALGSDQVFAGIRCSGACPSEATIRERVRATNPAAIVASVSPLDVAYYAQFERPRAAAGLALAFSGIALITAAAGLFSVLSYAVRRRRREFGIRIAMGAQLQEIRRLVLRDGAYVALGGFGLGILAAAVFSRPLTTLAFHVTLRDAIVWLPAVAVVTVSTLLASWHPASSAARIDPLVLLRDE